MVGPEGMIYAFEPSANRMASLKRTLELNNITNVHCYQMALGAQELHIRENRRIRGSHIETTDAGTPDAIPSTTLDAFWQKNIKPQKIDFIKIDTDGYELEVLKGAAEVIRHNPEIHIISEYLPTIDYRGVKGEAVLEAYREMGFDLHTIQTAHRPLPPEADAEFIQNVNKPLHMYCHDLLLTPRRSSE